MQFEEAWQQKTITSRLAAVLAVLRCTNLRQTGRVVALRYRTF